MLTVSKLQILVSGFYSMSAKCTEKEWSNFWYYLETSKETIKSMIDLGLNTHAWTEYDLHIEGLIQQDGLDMTANLIDGSSNLNLITFVKGPSMAKIITTPLLHIDSKTPFKYFASKDPNERSTILIYENPKLKLGVFMVRRIERSTIHGKPI
jgi:hypothetical protein